MLFYPIAIYKLNSQNEFLKNRRTILNKRKIVKVLKLAIPHKVKRVKRNNQLLLCEAPKSVREKGGCVASPRQS